MGRRTKANIARLNNLSVSQKQPRTWSSDDESSDFEPLEEVLFMLDEFSDSDSDMGEGDFDSELENLAIGEIEDELEGLKNEDSLHRFSAILFTAHAVKAEQEAAETKPKRKKHYTGNSSRTKRYHAQKRRKLAESGQRFIHTFFSKSKDPEEVEELDNKMDEHENSSEVDQDVDEAMRHLFPKPKLEGSVSQESCSPSAWAQVEELLRQLRDGKHPIDNSLESTSDQLLNRLSYKDFPALRRAKAKLTVKSKDKKLDVFFRSRITAIVATLNLYMDPDLNYVFMA